MFFAEALGNPCHIFTDHRIVRAYDPSLYLEYPETSEHLDLKNPDVLAQVHITLDVPKDDCPVRVGGQWRLWAGRSQPVVLDVVAYKLEGIRPHGSKFRRYYDWSALVVKVLRDPLDWFPKPKWMREGDDVDILSSLSDHLKLELGILESSKFTSEGGIQ